MTDQPHQHVPGGGFGDGAGGPEVHGTRAVAVSFIVAGALAVAGFVGFVVTGSASLLTDAAHSLARAGGQGVLSRGGVHARRQDQERYRAGRGREGYFWGFVVSIVSFALAAAFAVDRGVAELRDPELPDDPGFAAAVLGVALLAQLLSLRFARAEARKVKGDGGYRRFVRRAESPELPVVLVHSVAAVVSVVLAGVGVGGSVITDDGRWDGAASVGIGIVLGATAVVLVLVMKSLLIGQGASTRDAEALRAALEIDPAVVRIVRLHTRYLGPEDLMVGARVELQHDLPLVEAVETVHRLVRHLQAAVPHARHVYLEPDVDHAHLVTTGYVAEHSGHIDPDDPMYAAITGRPIDPDDDIWTE